MANKTYSRTELESFNTALLDYINDRIRELGGNPDDDEGWDELDFDMGDSDKTNVSPVETDGSPSEPADATNFGVGPLSAADLDAEPVEDLDSIRRRQWAELAGEDTSQPLAAEPIPAPADEEEPDEGLDLSAFDDTSELDDLDTGDDLEDFDDETGVEVVEMPDTTPSNEWNRIIPAAQEIEEEVEVTEDAASEADDNLSAIDKEDLLQEGDGLSFDFEDDEEETKTGAPQEDTPDHLPEMKTDSLPTDELEPDDDADIFTVNPSEGILDQPAVELDETIDDGADLDELDDLDDLDELDEMDFDEEDIDPGDDLMEMNFDEETGSDADPSSQEEETDSGTDLDELEMPGDSEDQEETDAGDDLDELEIEEDIDTGDDLDELGDLEEPENAEESEPDTDVVPAESDIAGNEGIDAGDDQSEPDSQGEPDTPAEINSGDLDELDNGEDLDEFDFDEDIDTGDDLDEFGNLEEPENAEGLDEPKESETDAGDNLDEPDFGETADTGNDDQDEPDVMDEVDTGDDLDELDFDEDIDAGDDLMEMDFDEEPGSDPVPPSAAQEETVVDNEEQEQETFLFAPDEADAPSPTPSRPAAPKQMNLFDLFDENEEAAEETDSDADPLDDDDLWTENDAPDPF